MHQQPPQSLVFYKSANPSTATSAQAANAQAAGAAAVLVVNNDDTGFFRMDQEASYSGAAIAVPIVGISQV